MHEERLVCQSLVAWAAWILRCVSAHSITYTAHVLTHFQDLFSQLFGGGGFFGGGGGPSRGGGPRKTKDLVHRVHVTLEDLYKGKTTKLALTRNIICTKCGGKGGKEGAVQTCSSCHGQGVKVTLRQMGPMIQQIQSACDACSGTGEIINAKDRCKTCNGKKVVSEKKMLEVHIDKGMKGGQQITFRGESDQGPGVTPGDVIIVIEEKPHERFRRQDDDLIIDQEIDLLSALGGGHFAIKHLDDRALIVNIRPGEVIKPGKFSLSDFSKFVLLTLRRGRQGDRWPGYALVPASRARRPLHPLYGQVPRADRARSDPDARARASAASAAGQVPKELHSRGGRARRCRRATTRSRVRGGADGRGRGWPTARAVREPMIVLPI